MNVSEFYKKAKGYNDTGFSGKASENEARLLNKDGSFNVVKKGLPFLERLSIYHVLITMSWWRFNFLILATYFTLNLLFACIYILIGIQHLGGTLGITLFEKFLDAFFFSAQTFTTVGYGRINPIGFGANVIASIESLTGLVTFALISGLFYGRFSRPAAKLVFSQNALMAPYQNINGLMFRVANSKNNQLTEVNAQVMLSIIDPQTKNRGFYILDLERSKINFLSLSWTIVHPVNENSPVYGLSQQDLKDGKAEFLILLQGFDDTYSQILQVRHSYVPDEIIWNAKFIPVYTTLENGKVALHLDKLNAFNTLAETVKIENQV